MFFSISFFGFGSIFLTAINIQIDNKAKITPEDNETINETLSPLTSISKGYSHLIRCDIASKANTTPDVIRDIFCRDISTISMFLI